MRKRERHESKERRRRWKGRRCSVRGNEGIRSTFDKILSKIIITGSRSKEQTSDAYNYINKVLNLHYDELYKEPEKNVKTDDLIQENKYIYKHKISNFHIYENLLKLNVIPCI